MPNSSRILSNRSATLCVPATLAGLLLASPGWAQCGSGGSCFQSHGPGCDNPDCCTAVCAFDAFCCETSWDNICVQEANDVCVSQPIAGPFVNPTNGNSYYILDQGTWRTLRDASLQAGGHLVAIHSQQENQWITNTVVNAGFPADFFVGLSDLDVEGQFQWVDSSPLNATFWSFGQPDNALGNEDCVQIWNFFGDWNDLPATAVRLGVFEVEVSFCGDPDAGSCFQSHGKHCDDAGCCEAVCAIDDFCCQTAWDNICVNEAIFGCTTSELAGPMVQPSTGRRQTLLNASWWLAAQGKAELLGGNLATIANGQQNEFIRRWFLNGVPGLSSGDAWIGANDFAVEGSFAWSSGRPFDFVRWAVGEPTAGFNEDVVEIGAAKGEWGDVWFGMTRRALVEVGSNACGVSGSCFTAHGGSGCEIEGCCNAVCAIDPFCCSNFWDALCASEGNSMCDPPVILGPVVNPVNGHRYYGLASATWSEAERVANTMGGHLAVPNNLDENIWLNANFIQPAGGIGTAFIGLHDQLKEGSFQSIETAQLLGFTAWSAGAPNNAGNEDIVAMGPGGGWNDVSMQSLLPAIIEVPCMGDLNGSRAVDAADLAILLGAWGRNPGPSDLNVDGEVDAADLALLLGGWGACATSTCCSPHGTPGCDQLGCTVCVCSVEPFCCQVLWDANCSFISANDCSTACQCGQ